MRYLYFCLTLGLTSCIEIVEDLKINTNGSGTFKYTINLSSSKTKVQSILALDSLNGERVIKQSEIQQKVESARLQLQQEEGISNVVISEDYTNYIIKLQVDFDSIENLERAIKNAFKSFYQSNMYDSDWISYSNRKLVKNIPPLQLDQISTYATNGLENGTYTSITRFMEKVQSYTNQLTMKSKSGTAVMVRVSPQQLIANPFLLSNTIQL